MDLVKSYLTENPCFKANVNRADSRYTTFQDRGPTGIMLHSVGCAQPNAQVFLANWNKPSYTAACVHAFIDANTGTIYQCLPWNYRGWHAGHQIGNNTLIGVEMCESKGIRYSSGAKFTVVDWALAQTDASRTYHAAVELFADICTRYSLNPDNAILSHREGGIRGIASGHVDPEHYWSGLELPYTMDGFRAAVKAKMAEQQDTEVMYRIQLGAFRRKDYAEAYLEQVKKTYPNAYLTKG